MSGEFASQLGGEYIAESQNQKEATANAAFDRLTVAANKTLVVACAPGTVTISEANFKQYAIFKLTGSLAGSPSDCEVVLPNIGRRISIINATDGLVTISSGEAAETSLEADESADLAVIEDDGVYKLAGSAGGGGGSGDFVGPASSASGNLVSFGDTTGKLGADAGVAPSTDGTFAANSDAKVPTEKAVKTYVAAAVTGLLDLKGDTDASANPNYPAASKGDAYYITVAGKIGGASGKTVEVGDVYVAKADNAGGTEASVGTSWFVLEHNLLGALLAANNLSDLANAGTARTNLGASTVGGNLFTLTNPSAISFPKIAADNSVSTRTLAQLQTDLQDNGLDVDAVGFRGVPQNSQSGNYTTVAADAGKHLIHPSGAGSGDTFTITANASVAYDIGTAITFVNMDSNPLSIAITSDTMNLAGAGTTGTRTLAQYGIATALKVGSTTWLISGTNLT